MPPKEFIVAWMVAISISIWQKGYAQSYSDLYSNKEVYRAKNNQIIALADQSSSIPIQTGSSSSAAAAIPSNYASIVGNAATTPAVKVSTMAIIIMFVAAVVVLIALLLLYLVRRRKRSMLRKELAMTNQDAHLSGGAITSDPYRSVSSRDLFSIPMPEDASQTKQPHLSVTSPTGRTTQLEIP